MKPGRILLAALIAGLLFLGFYQWAAEATLKHKRETGRKCTFCHTSIPEEGAEDPRLNEDGEEFKENDYKLTEEQKRKPDP